MRCAVYIRVSTKMQGDRYSLSNEIDIYDICWKYGIRILPFEETFIANYINNYNSVTHLKALSIPSPKGRRGLIFIKKDLDPIEKKLLLAEEFCHCYSHYILQIDSDPITIGKTEAQAKRMSAYLLIPSVFLKNMLSTVIDQEILISNIADYFLVSQEFARYSVNRHIIPDTHFQNNSGDSLI